jgi:restriction system protein
MPDIFLPDYKDMMNPALQALRELGGSAAIDELFNKVVEIMGLDDDQLSILHNPDRGSRSEVEYRLAWTRTYLKKYGLIENSTRGVWALTQQGMQTEMVDPDVAVNYYRKQLDQERAVQIPIEEESDAEISWRADVLNTILEMDASAFERLIQRVLRESGFIQVEVTGRSGDGGIDGKGIMRLGGLMSFHVIFQCKRYQGSVNASTVRDFRGAMVGRADKGLLITSGSFTRGSLKESTRDGAPALDLIDGDQLINILKDLELGIQTEIIEVEQVSIDHNWFQNL